VLRSLHHVFYDKGKLHFKEFLKLEKLKDLSFHLHYYVKKLNQQARRWLIIIKKNNKD